MKKFPAIVLLLSGLLFVSGCSGNPTGVIPTAPTAPSLSQEPRPLYFGAGPMSWTNEAPNDRASGYCFLPFPQRGTIKIAGEISPEIPFEFWVTPKICTGNTEQCKEAFGLVAASLVVTSGKKFDFSWDIDPVPGTSYCVMGRNLGPDVAKVIGSKVFEYYP